MINPRGELIPITAELRQAARQENDRIAAQGMRVLAFAGKGFDPAGFDPQADLLNKLNGLTFFAMVGIVDPPRPEAKAAIAEAHSAGIQVRMITGDHVTTAAAIAAELGITGRAISGQQFAAMSDEELFEQIDEIGVIARVAPEDKVRLVKILQEKAHIVAMTGDGVNDAPALKTADIGVAMGITGTDATKEAAAMILTDDNFATIIKAVESGRALYLRILKGHTAQVAGALALTDGRLLSWSYDSTLRLWDCHSGACLAVLEGHTHWVYGALALADGRLLSWSSDHTLRLWDSHSGACLAVLEGHRKGVGSALVLADGRLLSWSNDSTLRLWSADGVVGILHRQPDSRLTVELVNYGRPLEPDFLMRVEGIFKKATMRRPEGGTVDLKPARRGTGTEVLVIQSSPLSPHIFRFLQSAWLSLGLEAEECLLCRQT